MAKHAMADLIVLLPGITGSVLKKDGRTIWGYSAGTIARALFSLGGTIERGLALPNDDPAADDLGDGVVATELMPDLHLLPGVWKIDGYGAISKAITQAFNVRPGVNFFHFPYDWRRDNRVAARKLARATHDWLKAWRISSGNADARLILIAHSMGGLVSRYFLECLEGWKVTRMLISFGTPYRGSLNALDSLANGMKEGPLELSTLARQLTSIYQLLPVFKCYDDGDGVLRRVGESSGIPNVDAVKAAAALAFHDEIRAAVDSNRSLDAYRNAGYLIHPAVGIAQQTRLSARLDGKRLVMLETLNGQALGGDGTVPRFSALPVEMDSRPTNVVYAGTQHGSLQNAEAMLAHLSGLLSGLSFDLGDFRKPKAQVALDVDDLHFDGDPILVRARPNIEVPALNAVLWSIADDRQIATAPMRADDDGWMQAEFGSPGPGAYRVRVSGDEAESAEDALVVLDTTGDDDGRGN